MTPFKLDVLIARAPYGGNGGISNEHPSIANWLLHNVPKMVKDDRIGRVVHRELADTPITMVRNQFVKICRDEKFDLLLMIDSDQYPDYELSRGDLEARPFWETTFDFIYNHYPKGPCVVGAPYCGPSPHQNIYVFEWLNRRNDDPNQDIRLGQFTREEAFRMRGIQPVAALPTGLILFDVRCFDLVKPPYFYYEYEDKDEAKKTSTEDVTATRDIGMAGQQLLGYNPVFCNWDAWAGHVKQEIVGKPRPILHEQVNDKYRSAVANGIKTQERLIYMNADKRESFAPDGRSDDSPVDYDEIDITGSLAQDDQAVVRMLCQEVARRFPEGRVLCAEIGSWVGVGAITIADAIGERCELYCVDHWLGTSSDTTGKIAKHYGSDVIYRRFRDVVGDRFGKTIGQLRGTSAAAAITWKKEWGETRPAHFVFIDADHLYEAVKSDIEMWLEVMHPEGILAGHDYHLFPGVAQAVNLAFGDKVHVDHQTWWVDMRDIKKALPEPLAPIETNGHAKPKPRKRKALTR